MNRQEIINLMNEIYNEGRLRKDTNHLEELLMKEYKDYIEKNPYDSEIRLSYALGTKFAFRSTIIDITNLGHPEDVLAHIEPIFEYDPYYPPAVFFYAFLQYIWEQIDDEILYRLEHIQSDDPVTMSLRELFIGYYYQQRCDYEKYEEQIFKSIEISKDYVQNYLDLANLYNKQGKKVEAHILAIKALKNVKHFYRGYLPNLISIKTFLGVHITHVYCDIMELQVIQNEFGIIDLEKEGIRAY